MSYIRYDNVVVDNNDGCGNNGKSGHQDQVLKYLLENKITMRVAEIIAALDDAQQVHFLKYLFVYSNMPDMAMCDIGSNADIDMPRRALY